ncbi:MAG TPA: L-threonylcarbamoyladenylate synthase [Nitrososphaerales archaeon]|nr:L-threonylcarbamoyladenylate synthase [Nitrososphaerales archaeon]
MTARKVGIDDASILEAASVLKAGGLVVYPTDTVYGLGAIPTDVEAVERLLSAKGRGPKPIPVLCAGLDQAEGLVELGSMGRELAERFWPGQLTVVAPMKTELPIGIHQGSRTLGVRVPAHKKCVELLNVSGGALTGTSANTSGSPSCRTADQAMTELGEAVDMVLDGGALGGKESTVVSVVGDELKVLRAGAVDLSDWRKSPSSP